jgi:hypothetical protein
MVSLTHISTVLPANFSTALSQIRSFDTDAKRLLVALVGTSLSSPQLTILLCESGLSSVYLRLLSILLSVGRGALKLLVPSEEVLRVRWAYKIQDGGRLNILPSIIDGIGKTWLRRGQ